jgi:prophage regulatory protein
MKNEAKKIIRLPTVIERTKISRSSIYSFVKNGTFPTPIKLSVRSIGFLESEIEDWINNRPRSV